MGFSGYLNRLLKAQVNYIGPMYSFPMTTNHEMAHQMGFASETECNFIGFLASIKMIIYTFNIQGTAMLYDIAWICKARMRNHLIKY
jgi:hypothetical protein